jgi:hypothetical protein
MIASANDAGDVSRVFNSSDQIKRPDSAGNKRNGRLLGREIYLGFFNAGIAAQGFLDTTDAGGAGHAFNRQVDVFARDAVACVLNRFGKLAR